MHKRLADPSAIKRPRSPLLWVSGIWVSQREIARQCGLSRKTVRRWVCARGFPKRKQGRHSSTVDSHREYLERRWREGCRNGAKLWRELHARGFTGRPRTLRDWIQKHDGWRNSRDKHPSSASPVPRASPRQIAWLVLEDPEDARPSLEELYRRSLEISACAASGREFCRLIRQRDAAAWTVWRDAASSGPLAGFTKHLCGDESAYLAALQLPWSNGPVEGHIHRLKLIKRSM